MSLPVSLDVFASESKKNSWWLSVGMLLVAGLCVFLPSLRYDFVYDDQWMVVKNPALDSPTPISKFFLDSHTVAAPGSGLEQDIYRPLSTLSFAATKKWFGLRPSHYRAPNIILHLLNGILLLILLRRHTGALPAFCGTALFLFHPVQVETAVWISQRATLMATAAGLGGFILWDFSDKKIYYAWGTLAAFFVAVLSKEAALPFVLILLCHPLSWRRSHVGPLIGCGLVAAGYLILRLAVLGHFQQGIGYHTSMTASVTDGLSALGVLMKALIWPLSLNISHPWPDTGPFQPPFLVGAGTLLGLAALAVIGLKPAPLFSFAACVFIFFFLPTLGIIPMVKYAADRFLYIPVLGVAIGFSALVKSTFPKNLNLHPGESWGEGYTDWFPMFLLIPLVFLTARRVKDWKNDESLWASSLRTDPTNSFAQACYAQALKDQGKLELAEKHYELALANRPTVPLARNVILSLIELAKLKNDLKGQQAWEKKLETAR